MKWIGQHIYDLVSRFRNDVYLEDISSGTIASGGNLGLDSDNKIVKQADTGITDLHGAGVDGSANQLLTDDGDGTITSESTLTYDAETLTIGVDDNGTSGITRLAHSDGAGGDLNIRAGDTTDGQTNQDGGNLKLYTGRNSGSGAGGKIEFFTSAAGSTGSSLSAWSSNISIDSNGLTALSGALHIGQTDTTLSRLSAGVLAVEGNKVLMEESEVVSLGDDDNGIVTVKRLRHTDDEGGSLYIRGGDATGTDKAGGDLQLFGGRATGSGTGGGVVIQAGETNASSGTALRGANAIASFRADGDTLLTGNLIFEGESPDANETTFSITDPTADRTITVPDSSGTMAFLDSTLTQAAQTNITSLGTLTALTVDDISLDGKTIGIIGDTNDTFTIVTGASGETTFTTDDAAGVNGNMVFSPDGIVTFNTSKLNIDSSGSNSPEVIITNNANDATGSAIRLVNNRDGNGLEDDDVLGTIKFAGEDVAGEFEQYGSIIGSVVEADDGDEAGQIAISVANDGTERNGITITAEKATASEVDVTIANGAASVTTVNGNLTVTTALTATNRTMAVTSATDGAHDGDVVYFGGTTSMTIGKIYHYKSDGTWEIANADAVATSDGLLGVALGAASDTNGVLLRGMVTLDHDPGAIGDVLYVQSDNAGTPGDATATAPSASGDCVRIIGYQVAHASNGNIWFNPDSTFVEVA